MKDPVPTTFHFTGVEFDDDRGLAYLHYGFDMHLRFTEIIDFGAPLPPVGSNLRMGFVRSVDALFAAAGVSYYKAFLPSELSLGTLDLDDDQLRFFTDLYRDGLAELAYRNGISIEERIQFVRNLAPPQSAEAHDAAHRAASLPRRTAVLLGGGKDSLVSTEILRSACEPMILLSVNPKRPMIDCAAAAGIRLLSIGRQIDPRLFELNRSGAINGHVPITAIVSLIAVAASFVHGYDVVVLSNERSADEPTHTHQGKPINHQHSKTSMMETALSQYITKHISPSIAYFSLLRPLSEIHIASLLARSTRYDDAFTSCNKVFRINQPDSPKRWCCDCAKCRFTFLMLAPVLPKERLMKIFGTAILDDHRQIDGYRELAGFAEHKPWDCVGEIAESRVALKALSRSSEWRASAVVSTLGPFLDAGDDDLASVERSLFTPSPEHYMPSRFKGMLDDYLERC